MAQEAKAKDEAQSERQLAGKSSRVRTVTVLIVGLPIIAILLPTFLVLSLTLLPTFVAYVVDRSREKHFAATVGLLNLCWALPAVVALWSQGQTIGSAGDVLSDVWLWLAAYGGAAIGWLIAMSMPPLVTAYFTLVTQQRLLQLRRDQEKLRKAWGDEVAGLRGDDSQTLEQ